MKPKTKNNELDVNETIILLCAFRYALGRASYVVSTVAERLIEVSDRLQSHHLELVIKEIKAWEGNGHEHEWDCDRVQWALVRKVFEAALEARRAKKCR